jgi:uncharacterized protein
MRGNGDDGGDAPAVPEPGKARAWQRMLSGRRLDLVDPSPFDVEIADIAHGLARVARWNGQTVGRHAFSVAQHSVLVLDIACGLYPQMAARDRMLTLLHDAPEYVIGDLISPFKAVLGANYIAIEQRLLAAIHLRFGLPAQTPPAVKARIKRADHIAAFVEATQLAGFNTAEAMRCFGRPDGSRFAEARLAPVAAEEAQACFLDTFTRLEQALHDAAAIATEDDWRSRSK